MTNCKMIYLLMKDLPVLRAYLYKQSIVVLPKKIREDIIELRKGLIIRETNDSNK